MKRLSDYQVIRRLDLSSSYIDGRIMTGVHMGIMRNSILTAHVINGMMDTARTKRDIKRISKQVNESNVASRNVMVMPYVNETQLLLAADGEKDTYICNAAGNNPALDFIWGEDNKVESIVVSGGQQELRAKALIPFIHKAQSEGIPIIALSDGNKYLNDSIMGNSVFCEKVGTRDFYYDIFRGVPVDDIAEIIYRTMPEDTKPAAEALLRSLINIVLLKHGTVNFDLMARYPLRDYMADLDELKDKGAVNEDEYYRHSSDYMAGTSEINEVASFIHGIKRQFENVFGKPGVTSGCNVKRTLNTKGVELFDLDRANNALAIKLMLNHILYFQEMGKEFALIVDSIPVGVHEEFQHLFRYSAFAISEDDFITSLFGGKNKGEDYFTELMGTVATTVLFNHNSGASCQKWSEQIGKYHKIKIRMSISQSGGLLMNNNSRGIQIDETDEPRVRAETISLLPNAMACVFRQGDALIVSVK